MGKYINPFTDYGFKRLFGEHSSKESLIDFLNALLATENVRISHLEYLPFGQLGEKSDDRITFFDLYCTDAEGRHFIVEIQQQSHRNFKERLVFYATYPLQRQAKKGIWAFELSPVYVIAILNFRLGTPKDPDPVSMIKLVDITKNRVFYDKLTFICIEIPRFKKLFTHIESPLEEWLFYLQRMASFSELPQNPKNPAIMKFLSDAELANLSKEEQYKYERSLRTYRDKLLIRKSIKMDLQEEFQKGLAKGKAVGEARGRAEGEYQKALQTAEVLLTSGITMDLVLKATGLDFDTVADLKTQLGI
jgi:predicted transposase/invertase (TIGR01784 family)